VTIELMRTWSRDSPLHRGGMLHSETALGTRLSFARARRLKQRHLVQSPAWDCPTMGFTPDPSIGGSTFNRRGHFKTALP
jgi:hypothetical protein